MGARARYRHCMMHAFILLTYMMMYVVDVVPLRRYAAMPMQSFKWKNKWSMEAKGYRYQKTL
jgi:hypothetical protein